MAEADRTYSLLMDTPIGVLELKSTGEALTAIRFGDMIDDALPRQVSPVPVLSDTRTQLKEYFSGSRTAFELALEPAGTAFEHHVWKQLQKIQYGSTDTYSGIAKKLGDVNKVRAVGKANGRNPIPIIIPCHRVIGANNKLTGYAGGIERKRRLLWHEGALLL